MRKYIQLTEEERLRIGFLLTMRAGVREIAALLGRSPSTISREIRRNAYPNRGCYIAHHAISMARGRRRSARYGTNFTREQLARVEELIREDYSPEQVSGFLKRTGELSISHETIYLHLMADQREGGKLYRHLRCALVFPRKIGQRRLSPSLFLV